MWCDALRNNRSRHFSVAIGKGRLFRSVLEESLQAHRIRSDVLIERDAYGRAAVELKQSGDDVRRVIQNLGRSSKGPWRAEQKLAALAAWLALR